MPSGVPSSSNEISMIGIFSEKNEDDYTADNPEEFNISLKGLSVNGQNDSDGGNINLNANSTNKPDQVAPHGINEFSEYLHTASPPFSWGTAPAIPSQWGNVSVEGSSSIMFATTQIGFAFQPNSDRVRVRSSNSSNNQGTSFSYQSVTYTGSDPTDVHAKVTWSGDLTGNGTFSGTEPDDGTSGGSSFTWTSGSYSLITEQSSSSDTGTFSDARWSVQTSSNGGFVRFRANSVITGQSSMTYQLKAIGISGTPESTAPTANDIDITATKSFGGGGGGFGGDICIHEDHLVQTDRGLMHIDKVIDNDPKIYGYDKSTGKIELADLIQIVAIEHDNLYKINTTKVTEDHILYADGYRPVSVNPTKAKENYGKDSEEIRLGDKLMRFDGTLEEVTSIEVLEGEHRTYTLKTELDNFYANGILVDSEI